MHEQPPTRVLVTRQTTWVPASAGTTERGLPLQARCYPAGTSRIACPPPGASTILMQTEDGQVTEPYSISAGLDYPGIGPQHAQLFATGRAEFLSITDKQALDAAFQLSRLEGIIPALETGHALACLPLIGAKKDDVVVVCLSGRGDKDLATYTKHLEEYA